MKLIVTSKKYTEKRFPVAENLIINIHPVMWMDHSVNKARVSMPGYKKYGNIQVPRSLYCTSI